MNPLVQVDPGLYLWTIFTFLVLAALLAKYAWKPLLAALEERQATLKRALDDTKKATEAMQQAQADAEKLLTSARAEAAGLVARTREDAARLRDDLKVKAQEEAAKIVANAQRQIQMETRRAIDQVRLEAVDLSVAMASKLLGREVKKDDHARLLDETLSQIRSTSQPN
jgi:F-type H+-transporting ATPase subunit b